MDTDSIPNPFQPLPDVGEDVDGGLVKEVRRRHGNSTAAQSKQIITVTAAVLDLIASQNVQPTPRAQFAALLMTLEKEETVANSEVVAAVCYVLSLAVQRLPDTVLESKHAQALALLNRVLETHKGKAGPVKPALLCVAGFLSVLGTEHWQSAGPSFQLLTSFLTDQSPKVRKMTVSAVLQIFAAQQDTETLKQSSYLLQKLCGDVLAGPEQAARAAAGAPKKERHAMEDEIRKAVATALQLMTCLKEILPLAAGECVVEICATLVRLFPLEQQLLSLQVCDVLQSLFGSAQNQLTPAVLVELLKVLLEQVGKKERRNRELAGALCGVLEQGYRKLSTLDRMLGYQELPSAVSFLVEQIAAEHDGTRYAAVRSLTSLMSSCLDKSLVSSAVQTQNERGPATPMMSIVTSIVSCLGPKYQDAQAMALPVVKNLVETLGREGAPLAVKLVEQLGVVYGALVEAEIEGNDSEELKHYLNIGEAAIGAAIHNLGPEYVLQVLPMNILEALDGQEVEVRTWLLPLLKKYVEGASLEFWGGHLLQLARALGNRAAEASARGLSERAMKCNTMERQIWNALPAFCCWARDADAAFSKHVKAIGTAFNRREELRFAISHSLVRLCLQSRNVLIAKNMHPELCGHSSPPGVDEEEVKTKVLEYGGNVPEHFTPELAARTILMLRSHSQEWLQALYNAYISMTSSERGPVFEALAAYASITEPTILAQFFKMVLEKLIQSLSEESAALLPGTTDASATQCTFIELATCIAGGVDDTGIATLYKTARHTMSMSQSSVQKKAYKLLAYVLQNRDRFVDGNLDDIIDQLKAGVQSALSPAKRFRLQCLCPVVLKLKAKGSLSVKQKEAVRLFLREIIMCTKEKNSKARDEAYELISVLANSSTEDPGGLKEFVNMVMTGLVSSDPHAISATIQTLSFLLYDHSRELQEMSQPLLKNVLMLIRTNTKEVVNSVLGFVKVCVQKFPIAVLMANMPLILDGILVWASESKSVSRHRVKVIVQRLAVRCGFDEVQKRIPDYYGKAYANIRKGYHRNERKKQEGTSEMDDDMDMDDFNDAKTVQSSKWEHSKFFADGATLATGAASTLARTLKTGKPGKSSKARSTKGGKNFKFGHLVEEGAGPLDLLEAGTSRTLAKAAAGVGGPVSGRSGNDEDGPMRLPLDQMGRLVITDKILVKEQKKENKRKYGAMDSDDDSDVRTHKSGATTKKSGASVATKQTHKSSKSMKSRASTHHSGARFKSKKGAGGDNKGSARVEPYAYWKMDRNLLSKRRGKQVGGVKELDHIVNAVKKGARKSKKMRKE